jgi:porin
MRAQTFLVDSARAACAAGALLALFSGHALAQTDANATLTGDWGGSRTSLINQGIDLTGGYTSEIATNPRGGDSEETRYTDQWVLSSAFDLKKLWGIDGATLKLTITDRNGRDLGADADLHNLELVQEVWGRGQTWRLTQFEYRQRWSGDAVDLKFGRMTVGEDFASFNCEFQNLTFCGSQPGNLRGDLWFNWPVSQWAARLRFKLNPQIYLQIGAYQVNPIYISDTWARHDGLTPYNPGGTIGALLPVELAWTPNTLLPGSYKAGFWYSSAHYAEVEELLLGVPSPAQHNPYGGYINFLQRVWGQPTGPGGDLFLNLTKSDRDTSSSIDSQLTFGLQIKGPFAGRERDSLGLAFGVSHVNGRVAAADYLFNAEAADNAPVPGSEYVTELYYGWSPARYIVLRPNLQYIRHPGGVSAYADVVVIGLKTSVDF